MKNTIIQISFLFITLIANLISPAINKDFFNGMLMEHTENEQYQVVAYSNDLYLLCNINCDIKETGSQLSSHLHYVSNHSNIEYKYSINIQNSKGTPYKTYVKTKLLLEHKYQQDNINFSLSIKPKHNYENIIKCAFDCNSTCRDLQ